MFFDFSTFSILAGKAYDHGCPWRLVDVLRVFRWYFKAYEKWFGRPHPPIRMAQIRRIINTMPFLEENLGGYPDLEPEDYRALIDQHFMTQYVACDYNINHFFSGRIRELRFHEVFG